MKDLTQRLDKIAASLEAAGLQHLAQELDVVSNTLESDDTSRQGRYTLLRSAMETLGQSVLGQPPVTQLHRFLSKPIYQATPPTRMDLLQSQAWKGFVDYLGKLTAKHGPTMEKALHDPKRTPGAKWEDLEGLIELLAAPAEHARKRKEESQAFHDTLPAKGRSEAWQKAEGLFKQADTFNELPHSLQQLVKIIENVKRVQQQWRQPGIRD